MNQSTCPLCDFPLEPQARRCNNCGVDVAMATIVVEQALASSAEPSPGVPISPEVLIPRLGEYLIEKGIIDPHHLQSALAYQKEQTEKGQPVLVGQALVQLGHVSQKVLDKAITQIILRLQNALKEANRDLEERVEIRTAELQRTLLKLTELNQLKANFVSNISHELRTPLTHIKGYTDLLKDGSLGELSPQQQDALNIMDRAADRLGNLIDDLIRFSQASSGNLSLHLATLATREIIQKAVDRLSDKAEEKGILIDVNVPDAIPSVQGDEEKITWVLQQLLDNAIKFTPRGGFISVSAKQDQQRVSFSVSDTGVGIPAEKLAETFEPFHQLDGSTTRRYGGTGLGLSLVKGIIDAHGALIHVRSTVGKGSNFEFSLPVVQS